LTTGTLTGPYITQLEQVTPTGYAQTFTLFKDGTGNTSSQEDLSHIHISYDIPAIPAGQELITRFKTDLKNQGIFYGDGNGLELRKRTTNIGSLDPIGGNYYPMVSYAMLSDVISDEYFLLLTDRSHGVGSLHEGEIEIMLSRRCLADDGLGVGEVLNDGDTPYHFGFHFAITPLAATPQQLKKYNLLHQTPLRAQFGPKVSSSQNWLGQYTGYWTALQQSLPPQIHLLSFESRDEAWFLRLQNIYELFENQGSATIDLTSIFDPNVFMLEEAVEMTMTANLPLANLSRLTWNTIQSAPRRGIASMTSVTLNPREIKTFRVTITPQIREVVAIA